VNKKNNFYLYLMVHNGMRPQDLAVLLKISVSEKSWLNKDIAKAVNISPAEVSYSLQRSSIAGLVDGSRRKVMKDALLEFISHGLPYVFPAVRGPITAGIATAWSSPFMADKFVSREQLVWPFAKGKVRGGSINPLYPGAVEAVQTDGQLYQLLALLDVMRIGRVREKEVAVKELERIIKNA
jgi:hypothetical protein